MGAPAAPAGAASADAAAHAGYLTGFGSRGYRSYVLTALLLIYVLNFLDRGLLGVLSEPIIDDLGIDDTSFGLLTGPAFAVFYSILGVPIAFMSETRSRVWIMTVCVGLWSLATALSGMAYAVSLGGMAISGFVVMLLFRMLVGVGEAGCTPPANSLIADYYPPQRRSTALGFYAMGVTAGTLSANLIGGPVNEMLRDYFTQAEAVARGLSEPLTAAICTPNNLPQLSQDAAAACRAGASMGWRGSFILIGLVGVVLAVLFKLTVKEPPRGYSDPPGARKRGRASFGEVLKELSAKPSFWWMTAAATMAAFCGYGIVSFQTSFIRRVHGFSQLDATLLFNVPSAFCASVGVFVTGWLAERMMKRHPNAIAWLPAIGMFVCVPLYLVGFSSDNKWITVAMVSAGALVKYGYLAAQYTIGQGVVGVTMRATATAILLLVINIIGNGIGPLVTGVLSDFFFQMQVSEAGLGELSRSQCRGAALAALSPELKSLCAVADPKALQNSLLLLVTLYIIPGVCFLMAMRTLQKDLVAKA
jgi:MFS family permease